MSVTVMTLTRTELSSQWRINHHQLLSLFHHPGVNVKKINVAKDSRAEAERVSSTIREYSEDKPLLRDRKPQADDPEADLEPVRAQRSWKAVERTLSI